MSTDDQSPDVLVVSTVASWMIRDLQQGALAHNLPFIGNLGVDLPLLRGHTRPAWWTPAQHAARLQRAGAPIELSAPGPDWLPRADPALLLRTVRPAHVSDLPQWSGAGFVKLAESKTDLFPARWFAQVSDAAVIAQAARLPLDTALQITETRLDLAAEFRCIVLDTEVLYVSAYRLGEQWWEPDLSSQDPAGLVLAAQFARSVLASCDGPRSWTLDVARDTAGRWLVVEANPIWCSGTYDAPAELVVAALLAAVGDAPRWRWEPDAHLHFRAQRMSLLY